LSCARDSWLGLLHSPPRFVAWCILLTVPGRAADMKMGIRRSGEHDPCTLIPNRSGKAAMFRIERPKDHPMWSYWNGRTRPIERCVVAVLHSAAKHVTQSGSTIRRCRPSRKGVHEPLHPRTSVDRRLYSRSQECISSR
jgi:hypothetical protein